MNYELS